MTTWNLCGWILNSPEYMRPVRRCKLLAGHRGPHTDDPKWLKMSDDERIALLDVQNAALKRLRDGGGE